METDETAFLLGLEQKEDERGQEGEIRESSGEVFGESSDFALSAHGGTHGAAATWTERGISRHLRGTVRARS